MRALNAMARVPVFLLLVTLCQSPLLYGQPPSPAQRRQLPQKAELLGEMKPFTSEGGTSIAENNDPQARIPSAGQVMFASDDDMANQDEVRKERAEYQRLERALQAQEQLVEKYQRLFDRGDLDKESLDKFTTRAAEAKEARDEFAKRHHIYTGTNGWGDAIKRREQWNEKVVKPLSQEYSLTIEELAAVISTLEAEQRRLRTEANGYKRTPLMGEKELSALLITSCNQLIAQLQEWIDQLNAMQRDLASEALRVAEDRYDDRLDARIAELVERGVPAEAAERQATAERRFSTIRRKLNQAEQLLEDAAEKSPSRQSSDYRRIKRAADSVRRSLRTSVPTESPFRFVNLPKIPQTLVVTADLDFATDAGVQTYHGLEVFSRRGDWDGFQRWTGRVDRFKQTLGGQPAWQTELAEVSAVVELADKISAEFVRQSAAMKAYRNQVSTAATDNRMDTLAELLTSPIVKPVAGVDPAITAAVSRNFGERILTDGLKMPPPNEGGEVIKGSATTQDVVASVPGATIMFDIPLEANPLRPPGAVRGKEIDNTKQKVVKTDKDGKFKAPKGPGDKPVLAKQVDVKGFVSAYLKASPTEKALAAIAYGAFSDEAHKKLLHETILLDEMMDYYLWLATGGVSQDLLDSIPSVESLRDAEDANNLFGPEAGPQDPALSLEEQLKRLQQRTIKKYELNEEQAKALIEKGEVTTGQEKLVIFQSPDGPPLLMRFVTTGPQAIKDQDQGKQETPEKKKTPPTPEVWCVQGVAKFQTLLGDTKLTPEQLKSLGEQIQKQLQEKAPDRLKELQKETQDKSLPEKTGKVRSKVSRQLEDKFQLKLHDVDIRVVLPVKPDVDPATLEKSLASELAKATGLQDPLVSVQHVDTKQGVAFYQVTIRSKKKFDVKKLEQALQDVHGPDAETGKSRDAEFVLPNDPHFVARGSWNQDYDDQWAIKRLGFGKSAKDDPEIWPAKASDVEPIVVAVIGSGVDWTHAELLGQIWTNKAEDPYNEIDDDGNGYTDDLFGWDFRNNTHDIMDRGGHDTHVAGVIAARSHNGHGIAGVNPYARIMALKVANSLGQANSVDISRAIFYAVDHGAHVINISYGGAEPSRIEQRAIDYAVENDVLVVVAAGNKSTDASAYALASCRGVITVAGTTIKDKRAPFSNWGQAVDLSAPAMDVLSLRARGTDFLLYTGENENYEGGSAFVGESHNLYRASGTSFAAPLVTGAASLIRARNPELSIQEVRQMLVMSTEDVETPGWDQFTGAGVLDVRKAITARPHYFLFGRITQVKPVRRANRTYVEVFGQALGSDFSDLKLQIAFGETPAKDDWTTVHTGNKPHQEGAISLIPLTRFNRAGVWSVRLLVTDKLDQERQARARLNLK